MNIDNMRLFCEVYPAHNIARVAEAQSMSHQAVSKHINAMERELRAKLFSRSVKGL